MERKKGVPVGADGADGVDREGVPVRPDRANREIVPNGLDR